MNLKILLILFALLSPIQQVFASADGFRGCMNALNNDAELQPIRGKVALILTEGNEQTFDMLANENLPTSDEAQAIYKWAIKREQCFKSNPPPPEAQIAIDGFNKSQLLLIDLYKGSINYGQFARQRQENLSAIKSKSNETPERQQNSQAQQVWQQKQQQQRSTQSTCGWQGNQWVCNTQPTGIDWNILQNR